MQLRSAVWAFAGVAVIALAGYSLNRGLHVGSTIEAARRSDQYPVPFYKKHCRYFVLERRAAGLDKLQTHPGRSREELLCAAEKRAGIRSQTAQGLNTSELAISRRPRAGLRASIIASLRLDVVLAHDLAPDAHLPGEDRREIPGRRRAVETSAASRHGRLASTSAGPSWEGRWRRCGRPHDPLFAGFSWRRTTLASSDARGHAQSPPCRRSRPLEVSCDSSARTRSSD
jgi:hypothetical protein